ncbi:MAG: protein kinase [Planctomycetes bacterium]|nr:protein kinase [Planctomycetota bacterium]
MSTTDAHLALLSGPDRQALERWLAGFDESWHHGRLAERVALLPPAGPLRRAALIELIRLDLRHRGTRASGSRGVEDYLKAYPELGPVSSDVALLRRLEQEVQAHPTQTGLPPTRQTRGSISEVPPPDHPEDPGGALPERFGRYRIVRKLGQGGMGTVYLAHDEQLDRPVALKVPRLVAGDSEGTERFKREARTAATLSHPNLCPIFDVGEVDGRPYLTMAYVEGRSLAELIRGGQPLPERPVADLVRKLALALEEAHRKGIIHRDLKPANIMVGERHEPVILDFGLARQTHKEDVRLTAPGMMLGTPAYMPPEQVRGDTAAMGPACDIYSLGVVLYELLTGRLPFQAPNLGALIAQVLTENPPPPSAHRPDLSRALESICLKAMAKDPAHRFETMAEFATALDGFLRNQAAPQAGLTGSTARMSPEGATPSGSGLATQLIEQLMARLEASEERARRRRLWPWLATGVAAVLAGVLIWVLARPQPTIVVYLHIERLDPDVKFVVLGDRRIPRDQVGDPVTLPPGEYTIKLDYGGGRVVDVGAVTLGKEDDDKAIEVTEDNRVAVVPRIEPPPTLQPPPPPQPPLDDGLKPPPATVQGTNLATATNGVVLIDAPAQYDDEQWAARHLVAPAGQGEFAAPCAAPLAVVVGFPPGRLARINALGINPTTTEGRDRWVREVEFEVSDTYPFTGFRKVGTFEVPPVPNDAILRLSQPVTARYVRFTFLRNGGGSYMELNKVLVMGTLVPDGGTSPPALVNVALAANGGKVTNFTSEYNDSWKAAHLIDGNPGGSWSNKSDDARPGVTIELGRPAVVRHVVINPYSVEHVDNAAREADVLLSETGKEGDFHSAGTLKMEPIGRDYSLHLKTPRKARFVRVRFLKNGGGGYMQAHEIKVFAEP